MKQSEISRRPPAGVLPRQPPPEFPPRCKAKDAAREMPGFSVGDPCATKSAQIYLRRGVRQRSGSRADCHRAFSCIPFSGDATRQPGRLRAVARWGFLGIGRSTPMARRSGGSATADWREPASSDRLPTHRSESPTGYSSAGCSPAEPASASPVTDNNSPGTPAGVPA